MLRRIKQKIIPSKLRIVAEAIFTSKMRYGLAVYGRPKFDFQAEEPMDSGLQKLQVLQNQMIRLICNHRMSDHIVMRKEREKLMMMSVNQLAVYHVGIEMFNIITKSSATTIREKLILEDNSRYELRNRRNGQVRVPERPRKNCTGFSYTGPKLFNHLPEEIRKSTSTHQFKNKLKSWIWENIPSI